MPQNISQLSATGTYVDGSTKNITTSASWKVSDTTIATVGSNTGVVTIQPAGQIWGSTIGVTATLTPGTPGTASLLIIASDSGSVAPRMPQFDDHWRALGLTPFHSYWGCQEPTGSLQGSGSIPLLLTASITAGNTLYQQPAANWLRQSIAITGGLGQSFTIQGSPPTAVGMSYAFLCYSTLAKSNTNDAGIMGILHASAGNRRYALAAVNGGPIYTGNELTYQTPVGPVTHQWYDRVHPYLLVINQTTGDSIFCSDVVVATSGGSPSVSTEGAKGFGAIGGRVTPSASFLYMAIATGTVAEALTTTSGAADFLSRLGWNVVWKDCPVDSGSIKLPFLPSHWKQLGFQPWTATWNLQDTTAQGSFASNDQWPGKSITGWTMTSAGTVTREYKLPNWTRNFISMVQATTPRTVLNNVFGPPPNYDCTGSMAMMAYGVWGAQGATATTIIMGTGNANTTPGISISLIAELSSSGVPILYVSGSTTPGTQNIIDGRVHPILMVYDKTNSRVKLYTDQEKITGSFQQMVLANSLTASLGLGNTPVTALSTASGSYGYFAFATGSVAEAFSDDGIASNFLKTLGWTIPW